MILTAGTVGAWPGGVSVFLFAVAVFFGGCSPEELKVRGTAMIAVALLVGCGASNIWQDVQNGDMAAVQSQIESGADVDARDALGRTPLYYSIYNEHPQITGLLVRSGADVNVKHNAGKTPLHLAAELGDTATVRLLLKAGAKVNAQDSNQGTPLDWAVGTLHDDTADFLRKRGGKAGSTLNR
ncbi:MAG: putative component of type VI protein secretion system [Limisphaerales bacterium]|jgi:predicted component of type VI protein secretion system